MRVLSQRPGELLCIINEETPEWIDIESVEEEEYDKHLENLASIPQSSIPVIENVKSWIDEGIPFVEDI